MKTWLYAGVAGLALMMAGPVVVEAQTAKSNQAQMQKGAAAGTHWQASNLIGLNVRNAADEEIGEIHDIVLDRQGRAQGVLIDVGGFLGMGERTVMVPWNNLTLARDGDDWKASIKMNKTQLSRLPQFDTDAAQ